MTERLNYKDIAQVANDFVKKGENPSSIKIHKKLGRGSMSTVNKHFQNWRMSDEAKQNEIDHLPAEIELPEDISGLLTDLGKRIMKVSQEKHDAAVKLAQAEKEEAIQKANEEKDAQIAYADELLDRIEWLEKNMTENNNKIIILKENAYKQDNQIDNLNKDKTKLEQAYNESCTLSNSLTHKLTDNGKTTAVLQTKYEAALNDIEKLTLEQSIFTEKNNELNNTISQSQSTIDQLTTKSEETGKEIKILNTHRSKLEKNIIDKDKLIAKTDKQNAVLTAENKNAIESVNSLKESNKETVNALNENIKLLQEQNNKLSV